MIVCTEIRISEILITKIEHRIDDEIDFYGE